jgi:ABC-type uncharacterized transport system involved in gliding motility auxiliary subunit
VEVTVSRRAPILGIAGLVFIFFGLLSHWWTYDPLSGFFSFGWYSLVHLAAGFTCLALYFTKGSGSIGEFVRQRSTRYGMNAVVYSVLFVAIVVMVNFLGTRYHKRFDASVANVNTISQQSREVLAHLPAPVHVDAFLDGGRDPVVEELFDSYRYYSDKIDVRYIDPQVSPEAAQKAGITKVPSLRVSMGDRSTTITSTDEESVTNAIHRVSTSEQKKIYFVQGHGEPSIDDRDSPNGLGEFAEALKNQNYAVDKLVLTDVDVVPKDAAAVVVTSATKPYFPHELDILKKYLVAGGRALILLEPRHDQDLVDLVKPWGIDVGNDVIVDQQVRLFQGPSLGLEPVVSTYGKHPAVASMKDRTVFSLARSVRPAKELPKGLVVEPIATTARTSWAETDLKRLFDDNEASLDDADIEGPVSLAVAASAHSKDIGGKGDAEFELAVFGDSTFVTNRYWRQLFNDALTLSVVGWLAGQEELMSIGPRAIRASRAHLSPAEARNVFYLSVLVLPELILLCGIAVWWRRSSL